ncbi:TRAP transporter large permease [Ruicaihuangia caeni]|uniref:TRAP transporter large permease n=1 Tax=Ruicaihuangia caeni TaxID=3042517 RepID=A0AAW6T6L5_9MICO|nr:TRAP transporter large permease [Klugiella sp. YN-L-19]MDI2099471.1 TRAP transporter large permease [Klugiella sp. YN-L-19]
MIIDTSLIIVIVLAALFILLALETPVAFALGLSGALGLVLLHNFGYATNVLGSVPFTASSSFTLTMIPMFILMGTLAVKARIAEHVFAIANRVFRKLPGGLGCATVMACAGFAAVSGSSVATAATMSQMAVGEMRKYGYPAHFATGIVAVAGTLGVMIPPSIMLVLYAVLSSESPAAVLAAGIVPGLLSALAYIIYIMVVARRVIVQSTSTLESALEDAALGADTMRVEVAGSGATAVQTKTRLAPALPPLSSLPWRGLVRIGVLFLIVMGGLYTGFVTPTESAAIGALAALAIMVIELRRDGFAKMRSTAVSALKESAVSTTTVFAIVVGSMVLSTFFVASRVPHRLTEWVTSLDVPGWMIVAILLLLLIPMGMALESISILVICVPLMHPIVTGLGFDGVWFAILVVKLIEVGLVTPPVGVSCFVVAGTTGVPVQTVFRGILPLVLVELGVVVMLFIWPDLVLFLPSLVVQ